MELPLVQPDQGWVEVQGGQAGLFCKFDGQIARRLLVMNSFVASAVSRSAVFWIHVADAVGFSIRIALILPSHCF